jgi:hypothetical protein
MSMFLAIVRTVVGVAFCWAVFALLSRLSELKFLVDAIDWSIAHASISFKAILLEIGKRISEAVSGYRGLVREVARLLHLPHLPSFVYDVFGVVTFCVGHANWLLARDDRKWGEYIENEKNWAEERRFSKQIPDDAEYLPWSPSDKRLPMRRLALELSMFLIFRFVSIKYIEQVAGTPRFHRMVRPVKLAIGILTYGALVGVVLSALFGIDFVYDILCKQPLRGLSLSIVQGEGNHDS